MSELKACPFCGSEARTKEEFPSFDLPWIIRVAHADGCVMLNWDAYCYPTEAEAIAAWNTRAALPRMVEIDEGEVERVARDLYAASYALDPVDENGVPDWGRGGFKTEIVYWQGLARAALSALREAPTPSKDTPL